MAALYIYRARRAARRDRSARRGAAAAASASGLERELDCMGIRNVHLLD